MPPLAAWMVKTMNSWSWLYKMTLPAPAANWVAAYPSLTPLAIWTIMAYGLSPHDIIRINNLT